MHARYLLGTDRQHSPLSGPGWPARAYTPHGAGAPRSGPALGFAGQHPEPLSGTYSLGNGRRVYNPCLMRFQSPDRLSPFARGGLNGYAYCLGDPINLIDPSGQAPDALQSEYEPWALNDMFSFGSTVFSSLATIVAARRHGITLGQNERRIIQGNLTLSVTGLIASYFNLFNDDWGIGVQVINSAMSAVNVWTGISTLRGSAPASDAIVYPTGNTLGVGATQQALASARTSVSVSVTHEPEASRYSSSENVSRLGSVIIDMEMQVSSRTSPPPPPRQARLDSLVSARPVAKRRPSGP